MLHWGKDKVVFKSDRQRKGFFGRSTSVRAELEPFRQPDRKPTFKFVKIKGQEFIQRTIIRKDGTKIVTRRPI